MIVTIDIVAGGRIRKRSMPIPDRIPARQTRCRRRARHRLRTDADALAAAAAEPGLRAALRVRCGRTVGDLRLTGEATRSATPERRHRGGERKEEDERPHVERDTTAGKDVTMTRDVTTFSRSVPTRHFPDGRGPSTRPGLDTALVASKASSFRLRGGGERASTPATGPPAPPAVLQDLRLDGRPLQIIVQRHGDRRLHCRYVFHGLRCRPGSLPSKRYGCVGDFRKAWATANKKAGFPIGRKRGGFTFHNTRRTAVTNL